MPQAAEDTFSAFPNHTQLKPCFRILQRWQRRWAFKKLLALSTSGLLTQEPSVPVVLFLWSSLGPTAVIFSV